MNKIIEFLIIKCGEAKGVLWYVIDMLWQLPQTMVAICYYWYLEMNDKLMMVYEETDEHGIYVKSTPGSVTLGPYIFLSPKAGARTIRHESGHVRQSRYLGPLYLIVIGIPSMVWAMTYKRLAPGRSYFWFYTERWADRLAGIAR